MVQARGHYVARPFVLREFVDRRAGGCGVSA